jgi:hypothetical protein
MSTFDQPAQDESPLAAVAEVDRVSEREADDEGRSASRTIPSGSLAETPVHGEVA